MAVTACKGNIVQQPDCDGIVNSANPSLRAGSGVSGAIYAAAGPRLEPYALQFAPLQLGEAVATPALSMGVYGYPADQAVPILVRVASDMAGGFTNLQEVRFVVVSDELLRLFVTQALAA